MNWADRCALAFDPATASPIELALVADLIDRLDAMAGDVDLEPDADFEPDFRDLPANWIDGETDQDGKEFLEPMMMGFWTWWRTCASRRPAADPFRGCGKARGSGRAAFHSRKS